VQLLEGEVLVHRSAGFVHVVVLAGAEGQRW
jgi:hypothetical protein